MKPDPKTIADLDGIETVSENILEFLSKHWDGIDGVEPKGYKDFTESYVDFKGMEEWEDNEREAQENEFKGFNKTGFVRTVSLPHIAYDDVCQGRTPIQMLIVACLSYGMEMGKIYGMKEARDDMYYDTMELIMNLVDNDDIKLSVQDESKINKGLRDLKNK